MNAENSANLWWLGGTPVLCGNEYRWIYLMEEQSAATKNVDLELLKALRPEASEEERTVALKKITASPAVLSGLKKLLGRGLILLDF